VTFRKNLGTNRRRLAAVENIRTLHIVVGRSG